MKALCVGDLHIGHGAALGLRPGERVEEQMLAWRGALAFARDRELDCVLFVGDAWERRTPNPEEILAFERPLIEHRDQGGPRVIAIPGNHDLASLDVGCALDVLAEAGLFELYRTPSYIDVEGVYVCCLPWAPVHRLVTNAPTGSDRDDLNAVAARALEDVAREMRAWVSETTGGEGASVLLTHFSMTEATTDTGADVSVFREPVLNRRDLEGAGHDAVVLGHIHRHQEWETAFYVGSLAPLNFGETGEHGVTLLDVRGRGDVVRSFVPMPSREFVTWDLTQDEVVWMTDGMMPPVVPTHGSFVKVRYECTDEQARAIDVAALRQKVLDDSGAYRVWVESKVVRPIRARSAAVTEDLSELAALELYLSGSDHDGESNRRLLELAGPYIENAKTA